MIRPVIQLITSIDLHGCHWRWMAVVLMAGVHGCSGTARLQMAAADAIEVAAVAMADVLREYDEDLGLADARRERAATLALVKRLRAATSEELADKEGEIFLQVLTRLQKDRRVALERYHISLGYTDTLREIATDLRRVAVDSQSLSDETRRYAIELLEQRFRSNNANLSNQRDRFIPGSEDKP